MSSVWIDLLCFDEIVYSTKIIGLDVISLFKIFSIYKDLSTIFFKENLTKDYRATHDSISVKFNKDDREYTLLQGNNISYIYEVSK